MNQIIPSINCENFECIKKRIALASEFAPMMHVDISDGKFTPHVSWNNPEEFAEFFGANPPRFEVHLMVEDPEVQADRWLRAGAKRLIVHLESMGDLVYLIEKYKKYNAEIFLAINPATPVERIFAHIDDFDGFLMLAVSPGPSGQSFKPEILEKIKILKNKKSDVIIEIDGGVNLETAKLAKEAGASLFVAGNFIFGSENPKTAYMELIDKIA
ncbi:MAG: hypothetical protein HYT12_03215 [Candidatus Liptonbacteria bacterium]|nr:hypothetical protein [Candidatus Liptonbacteria bacterium]